MLIVDKSDGFRSGRLGRSFFCAFSFFSEQTQNTNLLSCFYILIILLLPFMSIVLLCEKILELNDYSFFKSRNVALRYA